MVSCKLVFFLIGEISPNNSATFSFQENLAVLLYSVSKLNNCFVTLAHHLMTPTMCII